MSTSANEREGHRARKAVLAFPLLALMISSCSVGPKYARPPVETASAWKEAPRQAESGPQIWQPAIPSDTASRGKWWTAFNDPQLNELEEKAIASNRQIAAAADSFLAARAMVRQARSQYYPTLTASPSATRSLPSTAEFGGLKTGNSTTSGPSVHTFNNFSLPFDASWEPDFWGRIRNSVRASTYNAQASAADLENVRLIAEAELAVDYFELRAQNSLKLILDSTVTNFQTDLDLTRSQYKTGLGSDEAVAQAEAQLEAAQAQDSDLESLRDQYEHAIAVLIGQSPSTFSLRVNALDEPPPQIPVGIPSELLERRPDIASAERSMAVANAQIGVAKAAYFPSVLLNGEGGFGNSQVSNWLTLPSGFWAVGAALSETIFDAALRKATVQQYRATYDQTVANYQQTVFSAFQQVEDNLASLRVVRRDLAWQNQATESASRALEEATTRFKAGLDPYLNVVVAQTALLNDQQVQVKFRAQQMVATVQLIKALGGGWNGATLPSQKDIRAHVANRASQLVGQ